MFYCQMSTRFNIQHVSLRPGVAGLFTLLLLFFNVFSYAQSSKGTIAGTVTDAQNNPLENVTISLKGHPIKVLSSETGAFSISGPSGKHTLVFSIVGHGKHNMDVVITAGQTTRLNTIVLSGSNDMDEVNISGKTRVKELKEQAFNVNIIDAKQLYNNSEDLNHTLNRTSGVRVREDGGVGSNFTFSLNGFSGRQVKFFLDGIPMDNFGSSLTLNNFPTTMAERIEVYKGVLPINLGGDALGGAINVVTRSNPNFLDASYGYGSFNTHKASLNAAFTDVKTGLYFGLNAFYNYSDNNYKVEVQPIDLVTGQKGPLQKVERFHDGYESGTVQAELGVTGKKYADKLVVGLIASGNSKDIQTGVTMEQVFGGRTSRSNTLIPTLKYKKANLFTEGLDFSLYSAYNMSRNRFIDTTRLKYNWLQQTVPTSTAELSRSQLKNRDNEGLVTANLAYKLSEHQAVSYNYVLTDFKRKSSDVEDPGNITFTLPQSLRKQIMGLAWQTTYDRFTATVFGKLYLLNANSFENVSRNTVADYQPTSTSTDHVGYGAAGAYFILPALQAKVSYERTYRLPESTELLGDGLYVRRNSALKPESSDNINAGALYTFPLAGDSKLGVEANFIYRNARDYIRLDQQQSQPVDRQYINVGDVRTTGGEAEIKYSWRDKIFANVNATYQNIIDRTEFLESTNLTGTIRTRNLNYGYRLPNMPYLFGNADLGTVFHEVGKPGNDLSITYSLNYVQKYYLTPNQIGENNQDIIPAQVAHNLMANYAIKNGRYNISVEGRNLADNKLFDNYLLQKPGRSFFIKLRYFISK
jgi:outer membrane receptor protein involved in Fe transport